MRILFLSAANSIHTVKWVNALADRGHEVYLVYNTGHEPNLDKINRKIHLKRLKHSGTKAYYLNARELRRLSMQIKPDVINVHYASGYGTLARKSKIGPILLSVWGSDVYDFPYDSRLKNRILKKNVNYASRLASTSSCMAEQLRKVMGDPGLEVFITPFGVDVEVFSPLDLAEKDNDTILLGNIKMLKPKYGIAEFVKAVELLLCNLKEKQREDLTRKIKVDIYGDGEQREELEKMIYNRKLGEVVCLKGRVPNTMVPLILSEFDVFCATSMLDSESFGVAVVEAMAMGVPVVATDVDGFKEVVENGETGIIVERGNVQKIAEALERLICDKELRNEMGNRGRKRVENFFNFEKNVDTMENIYREMMGLR